MKPSLADIKRELDRIWSRIRGLSSAPETSRQALVGAVVEVVHQEHTLITSEMTCRQRTTEPDRSAGSHEDTSSPTP